MSKRGGVLVAGGVLLALAFFLGWRALIPSAASPNRGSASSGRAEDVPTDPRTPDSPAVPSAFSPLVKAPEPVSRAVKLSLFRHDGRRPAGCQIIALGERRSMTDHKASDAVGTSLDVDLKVFGRGVRLLVIPYDPDLAVGVLNLEPSGESAALVLAHGLEAGGVVVNALGEPVADKFVSAEIPLPPAPAGATDFAHRIGDNVDYVVDGDSLTITTSTAKDGSFRFVSLPSSVTKLSVGFRDKRVEQFATGLSVRVILPAGSDR